MKNISYALIVLVSLFSVSSVANAQPENYSTSQEAIVSFDSKININVDNSANVTETIVYTTGNSSRHGIYRDIRPVSSEGRIMSIVNVSVVDQNGNMHQYAVTKGSRNVQIKIGDPNTTFTGKRIYIIKYKATKAVAQLKDLDEMYWNVTGNQWAMPIYKASASVTLPNGTSMMQSACYYGVLDSKNQCKMENTDGGVYSFSAPSVLGSKEGLTVAVGFPKGVVTLYSTAENRSLLYSKYLPMASIFLLPLIVLFLSLWYWYRNGRDPKGTGVIVPQYDVLDGLTPMEVAGIVKENITSKHISAEIIYLAIQGCIKIRQLEEKLVGLIKLTDYEITKIKDSSSLSNSFDQTLLDSLFNTSTSVDSLGMPVVRFSDLKYVFSSESHEVVLAALDALLNKGYYEKLGRMKSGNAFSGRIVIFVFLSIWSGTFFGVISNVFSLDGNPFPFIVSILLSAVIYGVVSYFNPVKTEKGVAAKEYLLGLKEYLQIAEKDRLQFHNAPEKRPDVFEKLLPYAMVLGVSDIWAKEFEGIYTKAPEWYVGNGGAAFSAVIFSKNINNFSSFTSSAMSSSRSSGGSGGGGSSGGGGGGGGGGSW